METGQPSPVVSRRLPGVAVAALASIGAGAQVAPHSVIMKGERLLPGIRYEGAPTRPAPLPPRA